MMTKKDVYYIISKFVENIIATNNMQTFTLVEMGNILYKTYNFEIPDNVIKTSIKRYLRKLVTLSYKQYSVNISKLSPDNVRVNIEDDQENNIQLMNMLYSYIEKIKDRELSDDEKIEIYKDMISFFKDNNCSSKWSKEISSFYILCSNNSLVYNMFNRIKEGAILYTGLIYSPEINNEVYWRKKLTIYLECDVLFHLVGYNGKVFQKYSKDMIRLINEMNSRGKIIYLKYFEDVKEEIDRFFSKAEEILRHEEQLNIDNTAMVNILNECETPADINIKKSKFYNALASYGIKVEPDTNFYSKKNFDNNIESLELLKKFNLKSEDEKYLRHINYSNIIRKGAGDRDIKKCTCIILSEASIPFFIEKEIDDGNKHTINMEMLTNKLWFDLKKGFGDNDYPSNFDVLLKAETIVSSVLTKKVSSKYNELLIEYKDKKFSDEEINISIANLRTEIKKPEEINESNIKEIMDIIDEKGINNLVSDNLKYKKEKENIQEQLDLSIIKSKDMKKELNNEREISDELRTQVNNYSTRESRVKEKINNEINRKVNFWKVCFLLLESVFVGIGIFLNIKYYRISLILPFIPPAVLVFCSIITEKELNILKSYKNIIKRYKEYTKKKLCKKYEINYFEE